MAMRTYSRKRPNHQVIEDVHSLCRLCLARAEQPVPIFTQQTDVCALAMRIMICVGLEVTMDECLPNNICSNCLEMLEQYYSFRKKCEASYQKLKSHQAAIKMMNFKEELKDKKPANTSNLPPTQRLRTEEAKNIYFKLDSDGIVQICDEISKNSFAKHKLVSIIKIDDSLKKGSQNIVNIDNNTNTEIHTNDNYELQYNNSNTNENNINCNKLFFGNDNIETTQSETQCGSNEQNFVVSIEGNSNIIDLNDADVIQTNNIERKHKNDVSNTKNISTGQRNHLVIEPLVPITNTTNTIEVLDVKNLVIDDNVDMENNELADERYQGNLVINEMETNEVAADGFINIVDHNQVDENNSGLPDILTTMLLDLGVLTRHDDSLVVLDHTRTVALETGDGNQFTLEFVEEPIEQHIEEVTADEENIHDPENKNKTKKLSKEFAVLFVNKAVCSICGKGFASNSGVKRHVWSVHCKKKPYTCRVCGRSFGQKEVMLRHELVHSESRPFKCASCSKSFTQRHALHAHARSHAPPHARALQLHRCARCPKVFLYPSGLSRHMMTHSGRVFVCDSCQKVFKDKSSLKRHMNNSHGKGVSVVTDAQCTPATDAQDQST